MTIVSRTTTPALRAVLADNNVTGIGVTRAQSPSTWALWRGLAQLEPSTVNSLQIKLLTRIEKYQVSPDLSLENKLLTYRKWA